jgi:hypothetical protein
MAALAGGVGFIFGSLQAKGNTSDFAVDSEESLSPSTAHASRLDTANAIQAKRMTEILS